MEQIPETHAISLLYVEDDPAGRKTLGTAISTLFPNLTLYTAENGEAGLAMFRKHRPDIVVTDIRMPLMDGIEMARHIRALAPGVKLIAATAMSDTEYLLDAIKIGISRYVLKPINVDQFSEAIRDLIAGVILERHVDLHRDLTGQLNDELERRVRERTLDLEASNRELEAFCYSIAHDLSAPLRAMGCYSSILQEEYSDRLDAAGRQHLLRIESASVRMGRLIDDQLRLAKLTRCALCRKEVNLSAMTLDVINGCRCREPERRVEATVAPGVVADGDPELVRLVLENLLDNAWKYTGAKPCASIEFGSSSHPGETVYFLRDNGIGFDMAYAHKIFIPFERLHRIGEFTGTGVGLAMVQRIVHRHGGRVWAEGEEGKGAAFFFTLG